MSLLAGVTNRVELRAQDLLITEIVTANNSGLRDEDGESQDWIEIFNPHPQAVSLTGWHLTDNPEDLAKWTFPDAVIPARGFVVIFASEKDRRDPLGIWHTNFKLDRDGEFLALVRPDGGTVASAFTPQFPPQFADVSYGVAMMADEVSLVAVEGPARLRIPSDDSQAWEWTRLEYDDAHWPSVIPAIGYERPGDGSDPSDPGEPLEDVTQPGDALEPTSYNSPGGEEVDKAIDNNTRTKYLNFDKLNAGLTVTPSVGQTVVSGLRLTSANDAPERDPTTFTLEGSQDGVHFTPIVAAAIPDFPSRFHTVEVLFDNAQSYLHYRLLFPTVRNAAAANSVQIAEVELLGRAGPPLPAFEDLIQTDVESGMFEKCASVYLRFPFEITGALPQDGLELRLRYDDGFVAWLNGVEIVRANAPATLTYNAAATVDRPSTEAVQVVRLPMDDDAGLLRSGANVLAVQALNDRSDSPSFLFEAALTQVQIRTGPAGFFAEPTPGGINAEVSQGRVADPVVSLPRGLYTGPLQISLACATQGATLRYTTDGSAPGEAAGRAYAGPISITQSTPLRVVATKEGWLSSRIVTHTYILLEEVARQNPANTQARGFPATWGTVGADYGMDPRIIGPNGQDNYGGVYTRTIQNDLQSIPSVSLVMNLDDLFGTRGLYSNPENRGDAWERPVSLEFLYPGEPDAGFQTDAGLRIQGGAFRRFDLTMKKSFRVIFREEYGEPMLHYPLFGPQAADRFNNIVLRANSNDAWRYGGGNALYVRDAFAMESMRAMGQVASHTTFMHLYLNGVYWGLYNPVERPDAAFSATYHGGDRETWDAVNQDSVPDGTIEAWNRMLSVLGEGMASAEVYQRIQGNNPDGTRNPGYENLLDVDNMIDYMILNFYIGNTDWPHRNYWVGRDREGDEGFQFYPWDSETALGMTGLDADRTGADGAVARPYAAARANAEFRVRFGDRVQRHFSRGGAFYVNPAAPDWDPAQPENNVPAARFAALAAEVESAMVGESARWGDQMNSGPYTRNGHWAVARDNLLTGYFPRRSAVVLDQLRRAGLYPWTEAPAFNQAGGAVPIGFELVLTAPQGTIYYTTNGADPRQPVEIEDISRVTFVTSATPKRAWVPSLENGGSTLGTAWRDAGTGFDDSSWTQGTGGVGYDTSTTYREFIGIDVLEAMRGKNGSVFIRIPFAYSGDEMAGFNWMTLSMRYDDGFVAYLNGTRVASANAPDQPSWDSLATNGNPDTSAVQWQLFDLTPFLSSLRSGDNLLAIQGFDIALGSSDCLIDACLEAGERRITSGEIAAHQYTTPLRLQDATTVKARVLNGGEWSALSKATFAVGFPRVVLTELHYHPADPTSTELAAGFTDADDFEFLELYNAGDGSADLRGIRFVDGIEFDFAEATIPVIRPGEHVLLVVNRAAFECRYGTGFPIAGEYEAHLSNSGERLEAVDASGTTILEFTYGTRFPWPELSDGDGPSLEVMSPDDDLGQAGSWTMSLPVGGTPGVSDHLRTLRIQGVSLSGNRLELEFLARAGEAYTIFARASLGAGEWIPIGTVPVSGLHQPVSFELELSPGHDRLFFRVAP